MKKIANRGVAVLTNRAVRDFSLKRFYGVLCVVFDVCAVCGDFVFFVRCCGVFRRFGAVLRCEDLFRQGL